MNLNTLLEERNITKYRLSKEGSIPYSTIADICCGKTKIEKCSAETIYKISKVLNCTMEDLIKDAFITESEYRTSFSVFKSNVCHAVKDLGDIDFLIKVLENDEITKLYKKEWYPETLYLLAMVDYLSRINNIPLCNKYDNIRCYQLDEIVYPESVLLKAQIRNDNTILEQYKESSIPEFLSHNIVEGNVRDAV